jgi:two-component system cell cycle response regulator
MMKDTDGITPDDLDKRAFTDPLTGLYNRHYFIEALAGECRRAKRYGAPVSCLMLDLDGFRESNETFGHDAGDNILREVAAALSASLRETDTAARYGADRFSVLLPETGLEGALQLAERLRTAVASLALTAGAHPLSLTASVGVFSPVTMNQLRPTTLIEYADAALRKAKRSGKNRVGEYSSPFAGVAWRGTLRPNTAR